MQTNPKPYSFNDVLQKKILTPFPVFKPHKDLTLNRALSIKVHSEKYSKY